MASFISERLNTSDIHMQQLDTLKNSSSSLSSNNFVGELNYVELGDETFESPKFYFCTDCESTSMVYSQLKRWCSSEACEQVCVKISLSNNQPLVRWMSNANQMVRIVDGTFLPNVWAKSYVHSSIVDQRFVFDSKAFMDKFDLIKNNAKQKIHWLMTKNEEQVVYVESLDGGISSLCHIHNIDSENENFIDVRENPPSGDKCARQIKGQVLYDALSMISKCSTEHKISIRFTRNCISISEGKSHVSIPCESSENQSDSQYWPFKDVKDVQAHFNIKFLMDLFKALNKELDVIICLCLNSRDDGETMGLVGLYQNINTNSMKKTSKDAGGDCMDLTETVAYLAQMI